MVSKSIRAFSGVDIGLCYSRKLYMGTRKGTTMTSNVHDGDECTKERMIETLEKNKCTDVVWPKSLDWFGYGRWKPDNFESHRSIGFSEIDWLERSTKQLMFIRVLNFGVKSFVLMEFSYDTSLRLEYLRVSVRRTGRWAHYSVNRTAFYLMLSVWWVQMQRACEVVTFPCDLIVGKLWFECLLESSS